MAPLATPMPTPHVGTSGESGEMAAATDATMAAAASSSAAADAAAPATAAPASAATTKAVTLSAATAGVEAEEENAHDAGFDA
jgi:hypothetical protein